MSGYRIETNALRVRHVEATEVVSPTVKVFTFRDSECAKAEPGQFLMLWIPGVDEIPISILSADRDQKVSVAVKNVGEATRTLHHVKAGNLIGVRGPFGTSFVEKGGNVLMVGGGTGNAPLLFLAKRVVDTASGINFVLGAKTRNELLFLKDFEGLSSGVESQVVTATEDGTCGIAGFCTEPLEPILCKERIDVIYACGPELMLLRVYELAEKYGIELQVSLERLMRCAIGLCGSCVIGRYRVCQDGPVFTKEQLKEVMAEFGKLRRDFDGSLIKVK